jgi:hypothetical protein
MGVAVKTWPLLGVLIVAACVGGGEDILPSSPNEALWGFCDEPRAPTPAGTKRNRLMSNKPRAWSGCNNRDVFITITLMEFPTEDKPSIGS